jgi:ornithine carbamoyltransferase
MGSYRSRLCHAFLECVLELCHVTLYGRDFVFGRSHTVIDVAAIVTQVLDAVGMRVMARDQLLDYTNQLIA